MYLTAIDGTMFSQFWKESDLAYSEVSDVEESKSSIIHTCNYSIANLAVHQLL